jgi:hypothetical protein
MVRGEGLVVAKVRSGALVESVSKTIPIVSQRLSVSVFPESGPLLRGVSKQRVYVQAEGTNVMFSFLGKFYSMYQRNNEGIRCSSCQWQKIKTN